MTDMPVRQRVSTLSVNVKTLFIIQCHTPVTIIKTTYFTYLLSGEPLDPLKNWPGPNNRLGLLPLALIITVELSISPFSDGAPMPQAHIIVRS